MFRRRAAKQRSKPQRNKSLSKFDPKSHFRVPEWGYKLLTPIAYFTRLHSRTSMVTTETTHKHLKQLACGAISGAVTKTATAPMERVKILLQVQAMTALNGKYGGMFQSIKLIVHEEGVAGLWKGNLANVVRVVPVYALKFVLNDHFKTVIGDNTTAQLLASGFLAGTMQSLCTYPLETVRTRLAMASGMGGAYHGLVDCAVQTVKHERIVGLYKGLVPTLVSGAPYVAFQMSSFELLKRYYQSNFHEPPSMYTKLVLGAVAGVGAQTLTYPGDTVRRRMQTDGSGKSPRVYSGGWNCLVTIVRREGVAALFHGCWINTVRAIPGAAIQFAVYDGLKEVLGVS